VIVAEPGFRAVTSPSFTEATDELLEVHRTVLFSALEGDTVAVRFRLSPSSRIIDVESNITEATATGAGSSEHPINTIPQNDKMIDIIFLNNSINQ
jgi:hypothetical protein